MLVGALGGAVLGALAGFLFLTERGRRIRDELQPRLAELVNEFQRVRLAADRARTRADGPRDAPSASGPGAGEAQ